MESKCSIIYNTCDKYEGLWTGFFKLLDKYWHDCNLKIILNTETKNFRYKKLNIVRPSNINNEMSWSKRIMNSLDYVDTPYVIMMLDDFYLKSLVDIDEINRSIRLMEDNFKIKCITFSSQPGPNYHFKNETKYVRRGRFSTYRVNAQIALWRADYLKKILRSYENPWQFELSGSFRSIFTNGYFLSLNPTEIGPFNYDYGFLIIRGMVNTELENYFREKENIHIDLPFERFDPSKIKDIDDKRRYKRLIGYFMDATISLFIK